MKGDNGCPGRIPAIDSVDFPGLCLADAGQGVRATDFVSSFPSGIHVGARYVYFQIYAEYLGRRRS